MNPQQLVSYVGMKPQQLVSYGNLYLAFKAGAPLIGIVAEIDGNPYYLGEIDYCDDAPDRLRYVKEGVELMSFDPDATVGLYAVGILIGDSQREYLGQFPARKVAYGLEEFNRQVAEAMKKAYGNIKLLAETEAAREIAEYEAKQASPQYFDVPDAFGFVQIAHELFS